jgi:hypothetical protein
MSLSTTDAWCLKPLHTFGAEGHQSSPSAPKVSAVRDRRGGGAVPAKQHSHNSSNISVIVKSPLHTPSHKPKSHVDRSQPPGRTWHDASEDHFPQQPPRLVMPPSVGEAGLPVCTTAEDDYTAYKIHTVCETWRKLKSDAHMLLFWP